MSRQCVSEDERTSLLLRIRVIAYGYPQPLMTPELNQIAMSMDPRDVHHPTLESCADGVEMMNELMIECPFVDKLGQRWSPVGEVPKTLVADVLMENIILPVKAKHNICVFVWWVGNIASFTRMFAPLKHGGRVEGYAHECDAIFADEERRNGRSFDDIARDMWIRDHRVPGDLIRLAGLPPYFQWEDFPQNIWDPSIYSSLVGGGNLVEAADGFMLHTVEELEMEAHKDMIQWAHLRPVLCIGPQLPAVLLSEHARIYAEALARLDVHYHASLVVGADHGHSNNETTSSGNERHTVDPTIAFLDKALIGYGPHSALYISFGSVFFPSEAHTKVLIETLLNLENPMPFIVTVLSGNFPEMLKAAVEQSGRGLAVSWAPQQAILSHPGMGWMLTHCGGGGTFEALSAGVPVIAWPFMGDQPQNALSVSQVLDTGFDLLQIRTGAPGSPALRDDINAGGTTILGTEEAIKSELRDILERAQGKDGARKRENAQKAKAVILNAVNQGGSAHKAFGELDLLL
ncbi:UDP-Glycosyltransferase/glycogen phosphorylase [Dacryopinax primogenitus]|uniref:UDP-Glycosyltransferase/glycogen phosphorylase n=1 Tax=Dacryopinax primogenitus (strain DJM 731) TaxID=1858805 RepID=M5GCN8_DACPD|nr:UDP-Glycosyltransferase/glycogen phosphorylase [Dacryopinax primogenitus]EJU03977.1 UDP-Glycosyltransferase/glycogen phosphorylase [Dacryopinax primogenitus]